MDESTEEGLGARFWLWLIGLVVLGGIAAMVLFWLVGWLWYAWGFFGFFLFLSLVLLGFGWIYDKRDQRRDQLV